MDSLPSSCLWQVASPGSSKALAGQGELTRKVAELQQKLDEEVKVRRSRGPGGRQAHGEKTVAQAAPPSNGASTRVSCETRREFVLVPAGTSGSPRSFDRRNTSLRDPAAFRSVSFGRSHPGSATYWLYKS